MLERVPDDGHPGELASPVGAEAAVVPRRVEVAPVEVHGVAREVIAVAGRRAGTELVQVRPEALDRANLEASEATRGRIGFAQPAVLAGSAERVPHDSGGAQRPSPQPKPWQIDPAEPAGRRSGTTSHSGRSP